MKLFQLLLCVEKGRLGKFCLFIFLLSAVSSPTYSSEVESKTILGIVGCKDWTISRKKAALHTGVEVMEIYGTAWALGYLSALNVSSGGKNDIFQRIDSETINLWVDRYCMQNPRKDAVDGMDELFIELQKIVK